ncbi:hypothetical protein CANCADRAFT_122631 [Tortispora caseinolytica NRRL Y-17796]|uniref:Cytochrome b5 heme-binding domain-containing protein n=1 Tax=Tortispora caseinolytica NRRL Y-17796 TaxID=767744 RepID=A0A1E4THU3_9ASCO|nr:hypothetical protein CANCADRAFT_122631 [Tortispora caseinolytica NRRL Y-17796]
MSKTFSVDELAKHNTEKDLWIAIEGDVFDLTKFQDIHPGGKRILKRVAGKDATKFFWKYHNDKILKKYKPKLQIGSLDKTAVASKLSAEEPTETALSANPTSGGYKLVKPLPPFGEQVPYGDPFWYTGARSPYYNETHAALRKEVRDYVEECLEPYVDEWDEARDMPNSVYEEFAKRGFLAGYLGAALPENCKNLWKIKSASFDQWDGFHSLIITDEIMRLGSTGLMWNLTGGYGIGLPPLIRWGKKEVVDRVAPEVVSGKKRICLCITEPDAGSDVANLTTTAVLSDDKKYFIVNGEKKWITNGIYADYFTVAVRTGGPGMGGISMLLIERSFGGVETRKLDCMGVWASGTTYISFEDVKVPVENLIGELNQGFKVIVTNFNHERMAICVQAARCARVCVEESIKYAHRRETFGKRLIDHDVIRNKIAQMACKVEATQCGVENAVYQIQSMPDEESMIRMGGYIAGLKAQCTQTYEFCVREASQVFGGLSYTRGGVGGKIERLFRETKAYTIPGGSEEIMLDLSIRQALRVHKRFGAKL